MTKLDNPDSEYWRHVLGFDGFTSIPRWTRNPVPGASEHEAAVSGELAAALRIFAAENAVPDAHDNPGGARKGAGRIVGRVWKSQRDTGSLRRHSQCRAGWPWNPAPGGRCSSKPAGARRSYWRIPGFP